jgi:hypothetical protein
MISKENRIKLFVNELNDITEENLRKFAEELIANADEYFFTVAASTSGKYHPQFDLGDGGLVRHTRCVAFFAQCEAISRMFTEHETNMLIVAAIAHDIKKLGDGKGKHTVDDHPKFAAEYINDTNKRTNLLSAEDENIIANMVYSHMGKWGHEKGMPLPQTELEKALQAADYIASRKELLGFDFRPTEKVDIPKQEITPATYIIDFGKNIGKTIKEVYDADMANGKSSTYLHWMMGQPDFNKQEARLMGMKYLYELGKLPKEFEAEIITEYVSKVDEEPKNVYVAEQPTQTDTEDDLPF